MLSIDQRKLILSLDLLSLRTETLAHKISRPPAPQTKRSIPNGMAVVNFSRMMNIYQRANPTNLRIVFHMEMPTLEFQIIHYKKSTTSRCCGNCDTEEMGIMTTISLATTKE